MTTEPSRFYITSAIDYPNSAPHMGHAYEKVVADFYARSSRLRGIDTRFLIGLDEHGQKIQTAATQAGKSPREFVDEKATVFRDLYQLLEISNDDFVRTSEPRHHRFVREIFEKVLDHGDIYKGFYEGDYCVSCEKAYTKSELAGGKCPVHEIPTTMLREESYFFRLGKYREAVRAHIEAHPRFIFPEERRNEILSRLGDEVLDLSISRSTFDWGIPLPNDPAHVLYVWFDALSNYMSALKEPADLMARYWPADCHVIGKDIIWFHTVIWPAMLLSAGHALPRQVYVHGFILDREGRKMSKQHGNVVDPLEIVKEYSVDVLRYYLLRTFSSGLDGKFSKEDLEERYQSELGNDLGNLVLRVAKLIQTRLGGSIETEGRAPDLDAAETVRKFFAEVDAREHHRAVETLWSHVRKSNAYLNEREPWKIADTEELRKVLASSLESLRVIAHLASPMMPAAARSIASSLGFEIGLVSALGAGPAAYRVTLGSPLFPRREKAPRAPAASGQAVPERGGGGAGMAAAGPADPFSWLELRVGRIDEVREHPNADSLYAMTVDLGAEKRSICAGLRAHLKVEDLMGRKVLVLANLKPAQLRGIESAGMILATDRKDGKVVPVDPGTASVGDLALVEGISSSPKSKLSRGEFEKAPLEIQAGRVTYGGKPLRTPAGDLVCDAEDGARVR
ncbi:MAG TPA: methionine--tRNA ligase [Planctomycetota bacterium]|nr:methionine--tRNA ligase [Planctomycetota bacterium]